MWRTLQRAASAIMSDAGQAVRGSYESWVALNSQVHSGQSAPRRPRYTGGVLIVMRAQATEQDIAQVCAKIQSLGFRPHVMPGAERTAVGITGNHGPVPPEEFEGLAGVAEAIPVSKPYKLVSREVKPDDTIVDVAGVLVGGAELAMCAGPCSVESREQILESARAVKAAGAQLLRGGAYKPRTSPYAFQGLGEAGPSILGRTRARRPDSASSPKPSTWRPSTWSKRTPTASRSARATCRIFRCCGAPGARASRCC